MATQIATGQETAVKQQPRTGILAGRRGRILRENITAYLFLAPAAILIFMFGIFPIFYATYVSLYKWRIKQGEYRGFANFVAAMGDLAYIFFGLVAVALLFVGVTTLIRSFKTARENGIPLYFPVVALIPGGILTIGLAQILLRFVTFFTSQEAIDNGFAQVLGNIPLGLLLLVVGGVGGALINRWQHQTAAETPYTILPSFITPAVIVSLALTSTIALTSFAASYIVETNTGRVVWLKARELGLVLLALAVVYVIWPRVRPALTGWRWLIFFLVAAGAAFAILRVPESGSRVVVVVGLIALAVAYGLWHWGMHQFETGKFVLALLAAAVLIGAGVYLVSIWPVVTQGSDPDFYLSFSVTVFYAVGAVPTQLTIALVLAYLLFQNIKGKGFFRVVFFIPYIAPTVAGAAVFEVLFNLRETSIANRFMQFITGNPDLSLRWLKEPGAVIAVLGEAFGFEGAAVWESGPSLALVVVILFSIWRFVGYDTVIFLAGLGGIPNALYEAAKIDGANGWHIFRHITLPLLSPTTFFLSVISVLGTFKAFNSIWVLRDSAALGTVDTASIYFFETFQRGARFGYAASMAIVLFIVMLTLTILQNRLAEKRVFYG